MESEEFDYWNCLCKLLCNLNVKHYPSVDTLCVKIMDTDMEGKYILPIFEKNEELKEMLLLPERTLIRYSIEGWGGRPFFYSRQFNGGSC